MKTYIWRLQHKNFKHQDIKQNEPPQKYCLGTISNIKLLAGLNRIYMAKTSPSGFLVMRTITHLPTHQGLLASLLWDIDKQNK